MLFPVLMMGDAEPAAPVLTTPVVANQPSGASCTGGGCTTKSGSADTINVSWTITGFDEGYFDTKVYRNGALKATLLNTVQSYNDTAPGSDGWSGGPSAVSYTYRVDVVSKNDGTVVATATAAVFNHTYFTTCPGPC